VFTDQSIFYVVDGSCAKSKMNKIFVIYLFIFVFLFTKIKLSKHPNRDFLFFPIRSLMTTTATTKNKKKQEMASFKFDCKNHQMTSIFTLFDTISKISLSLVQVYFLFVRSSDSFINYQIKTDAPLFLLSKYIHI